MTSEEEKALFQRIEQGDEEAKTEVIEKIYSDILNGTMDTYASIISNNLNAVMKILTSVTFILAIPTLIASVWGMNVELPFQRSPLGFAIITVISVILCVIATIWLKRKHMLN